MYDMDIDVAPSEGGEKYAFLVCGHANSSSFYNNTTFVYDMLIDHGYKKENIVTLYGEGEDPVSIIDRLNPGDPKNAEPREEGRFYKFRDHEKIVDGAAYRSNIEAAFADFAEKITDKDDFFFYSTDHGGRTDGESTIVLPDEGSQWGYDELTETEFGVMLEKIDSRFNYLIFDQCHSGGFAETFGKGNSIGIGACLPEENSYIDFPMDGFPGAFFPALAGKDFDGNPVDADTNGDGRVSFAEAFQYALENDPFANGSRYYQETPILCSDVDPETVFLEK